MAISVLAFLRKLRSGARARISNKFDQPVTLLVNLRRARSRRQKQLKRAESGKGICRNTQQRTEP
jgi:hypothetical protein